MKYINYLLALIATSACMVPVQGSEQEGLADFPRCIHGAAPLSQPAGSPGVGYFRQIVVTDSADIFDLSVGGTAVIENLIVTGSLVVPGGIVPGPGGCIPELCVTGSVTVGGRAAFGSSLLVAGSAAVGGALAVGGSVAVSGALSVAGSTALAGSLNAGMTTLLSLTVLGDALVTGTFGVASDVTIVGALGVEGPTTLEGTLGVVGSASFSSNLGVLGVTTLAGTLSAGSTSISSLDVAGNATIEGNLGVEGVTTLTGSLGVFGITTLNDTLGVLGATTLAGSLSAGPTMVVSLTVVGDVMVTGTLDVVGLTNLGALQANDATIVNLAVTGTLGGLLSDARLKTEVKPIDAEEALQAVLKLPAVRFRWINPELHGADKDTEQVGFLAQDIEEVIPGVVMPVTVNKKERELVGDKTGKGIRLGYEFVAYLAAAVQGLYDKLQVAIAATEAQALPVNFTVQKDMAVGGSLTVDGASNLGPVNAGSTSVGSLTVSGDTVVQGALNVTGKTTVGVLDVTTATIKNLKVTGSLSGLLSDMRLKKNIRAITPQEALLAVMKLQAVRYEWINPELHGSTEGKQQAGFLAQNVEPVIPEVIIRYPVLDEEQSLVPDGEAKALSIGNEFPAYLAASVQALYEMLQRQAQTIAELEARLDAAGISGSP